MIEIKKGKAEEYELHRTLTVSNSFTLVLDVIRFLLDSLSKFRKATNAPPYPSVCPSVCSSARNNSASIGQIFMKSEILIFSKIPRILKFY